ncbi:UDP-N-acetylmuramyl tripeptide synthase [Legionella oakridgensis ATCC 33761 = DSM 21215]|uniref:UDP-N-acetylmuramyl tripeptide synthase n=1 Tax=Legionella oakridgensis ATCC 33761 = DSM 21215 TaxID=1268635 RepID=W0BAU6_9GAMM|nr:Mur ligase domain-containing protein [Legionella oakridgensis]AHE67668.1 UDP-N-acetylmuramyl tripeptide synthase [Legionella oakridgensis ATCC 33761 = DSM 21215]
MNLAKLLNSWLPNFTSDCEVLGLHNDSRQIKPGYLFIAYPGAAADGRLYIHQAVKAGAVAVVYDPECLPDACLPMPDVPCLPIRELGKNWLPLPMFFMDIPHEVSRLLE